MTEATARTAIKALEGRGVTEADIINVTTRGSRSRCDLVFKVNVRQVTLVQLTIDSWDDLPAFVQSEMEAQR